ncbi:MAG: hypothetical protein ACTSQP_19640 [Promethearchaeota archaeon]
MTENKNLVLFDSLKDIINPGDYYGSIISKCKDQYNSIIFSDNISITEFGQVSINEGLMVGFDLDEQNRKKVAFSRKDSFSWDNIKDSPLEYSVLIPQEIMNQYDEGQFSDAFPFTLNLLHTAGLYLNDYKYPIDHLDFFKGEILKNPIALIFNGICIADRVVIDHRGDPVFYDCIIVGRDRNEDLSASYEPIANVDDKVVQYIIILGIEELKF